MSTTTIYVLRLQNGKYYIGKSDNVMMRYQEHLNGNGSAWTRKYKPISFEKSIENVSPFEEDKITKEYMSKYGIDNVRGGSYTQLELSEFHKAALEMEIRGANDLCTQCGRTGHFIKDCYAIHDVSGNKIEYEYTTNEESSDEESSDDEDYEWIWRCDHCHKSFTTKYACEVHEKSCTKHYSTKEISCYRCGNIGHYSSNCYASRHVKGYYLD